MKLVLNIITKSNTKKVLLFFFTLFGLFCFSQQTRVIENAKVDNKIYTFSKRNLFTLDSIALFVNSNFNSNIDKVRAYYTWVALNISYDNDLLEAYKANVIYGIKSVNGHKNQQPDTVLKYKKAVCEGYSLVFNELCKRSNIKSKMIIGVSKNSEDGEANEKILHAWNIVLMDTVNVLLDVTWANGYVTYDNKYVKKFSDKFFDVQPNEFIKTHWPLDMMWQLIYFPYNKLDFYAGKNSSNKNYFNYKDSINAYFLISEENQKLIDYAHYYRYDKENKIYAKEHDYLIYNKSASIYNIAAAYFDDYLIVQKKIQGKPITKANVSKLLKQLEKPVALLNEGISYSKANNFLTLDVKREFDNMNTEANNRLYEIEKFKKWLLNAKTK